MHTTTPTLLKEEELLELMEHIENAVKLVKPKEAVGTKDFHRYYQTKQKEKEYSIFIPESPFKQLINIYNGLAMEAILNGKTFDLGKHLGILLIKRINMVENSMISIDWKATKEISAELNKLKLIPREQTELYKLAWLSGKSKTAYYFTLYNFTMTKKQIEYAGQMVNPKKKLAELVQNPIWTNRYYKTKKYGELRQYTLQGELVAKYKTLKDMYAALQFRIVNVLRAANFPHLTAYGYKWEVDLI